MTEIGEGTNASHSGEVKEQSEETETEAFSQSKVGEAETESFVSEAILPVGVEKPKRMGDVTVVGDLEGERGFQTQAEDQSEEDVPKLRRPERITFRAKIIDD